MILATKKIYQSKKLNIEIIERLNETYQSEIEKRIFPSSLPVQYANELWQTPVE